MSESSERRAEELEQRLQDQPGSRLFVQLAEEYRRLERYDDAVRTLEKGLEDQPTYLSARVLLGRCLLESGDAVGAVPELEKVLRQDQTHLLAHKLLAEAHLETGDLEAARQRLDLYEMLNESDPEIDELRARLSPGDEPQTAAPPSTGEPDVELGELEELEDDEDLFDLGPPQPQAPAREDEDLLGVWDSGPGPAPEPVPSVEEAQATPEAPEPRPPAEPHEAGVPDDPFGDLWSPQDRQRLDVSLAQEGLFGEPPAEDREVGQAGEPEPEAPRAPAEPEAQQATVTLGRLYLQQGHQDEARRIFREVLDREPDHETARAELLRLETPEPLTAADLEDPGAGSLGLTERKIRMLDHYLRRIRQAAEHVH